MTQDVTAEESHLLVQGMDAAFGQGAVVAAKRLRANVFETDTQLALPVEKAASRVKGLIEDLGSLIDEASTTDGHRVRGMIGAGSMNMNPTVVTVTLTGSGPGATTARIRGVAKEGLIKQRAGQKAAERVADALK
jgi:hypothetical protein